MNFNTNARSLVVLTLCALLAAPCFAVDEPKKPDAPDFKMVDSAKAKAETAKDKAGIEKFAQILAVLGTVITVFGAAITALPKAAESISLKARRKKELEHIEALTELMDKIKKSDVLTKTTQENVSAQIEAEIAEALDGLNRNREKRQKALESKTVREQPDLTFVQRALLWYRPHGIRAWIPHVLAFSLSTLGLFTVLLGLLISEEPLVADLPVVATILFCVLLWWLPFRAWALRERRRWRAANPLAPTASSDAELASAAPEFTPPSPQTPANAMPAVPAAA